MSRSANVLGLIALVAGSCEALAQVAVSPGTLGRPATAADIDAWNIDVRSDGQGLPVGQGTPHLGRSIFDQKCAMCHGKTGRDAKEAPNLAGGVGQLQSDQPKKTIGSFWPFATTLYDFIHRAMPLGQSQSLGINETYAVTAYVLYVNGIIKDENFKLDQHSLPAIQMPNRDGFDKDDRRTTEKAFWPEKRCSENCREPAKILSAAQPKK